MNGESFTGMLVITVYSKRIISFLLGLAIMLITSSCTAVNYEPSEKRYAVDHIEYEKQLDEREGKKVKLLVPTVTRIDNHSNILTKERQLGKVYVNNNFIKSNGDFTIDITRNRSRYKASTPLFYTSEDQSKSANFLLSVERGREVMAGLEFSFNFDLSE